MVWTVVCGGLTGGIPGVICSNVNLALNGSNVQDGFTRTMVPATEREPSGIECSKAY